VSDFDVRKIVGMNGAFESYESITVTF